MVPLQPPLSECELLERLGWVEDIRFRLSGLLASDPPVWDKLPSLFRPIPQDNWWIQAEEARSMLLSLKESSDQNIELKLVSRAQKRFQIHICTCA